MPRPPPDCLHAPSPPPVALFHLHLSTSTRSPPRSSSPPSHRHTTRLLWPVQPGHAVLDLCAAPGSKTGQLLEALSQLVVPPAAAAATATTTAVTAAATAAATTAAADEGFVVANDCDYKRCHLLVHQVRARSTLFARGGRSHAPPLPAARLRSCRPTRPSPPLTSPRWARARPSACTRPRWS